tara:strand:- start:3306 stop:3530 length:225 start_codon:yes stop_codon:yes gene_type:complete
LVSVSIIRAGVFFGAIIATIQAQALEYIYFRDTNKYKLKNNTNKDNISATMLSGLLYIKIPKIKNKTASKIKIT